MPQPYRNQKVAVQWGAEHARRRPHIAALIAEIIGRWSSIEQSLGILLASILRASPVAAMEMYLAIRNQRAQKDALDGAAEAELSSQYYQLYKAIRVLVRSCEKERDAFAHRTFGFLRDDPYAVLLGNPRDLLKRHAGFMDWLHAPREGDKYESKRKPLKVEFPMLYRQDELLQIIKRMSRTQKHLAEFIRCIDPADSTADRRYQSLCAQSDIAAILHPKSPPSAQP